MKETHIIIYPLGWLTILIILSTLFFTGYVLGAIRGYGAKCKELENNFDFESDE